MVKQGGIFHFYFYFLSYFFFRRLSFHFFLLLEKAPVFFADGFSAAFYRCVPGGCDVAPAAFERGWDPPRSLRELSPSSCS